MSKNPAGLRVVHRAFYWLGVILALACGAIILIEHTTLLHRFERTDMPPAMVPGALAILAFMIGEYLNSVLVKSNQNDRDKELRRAQTEPAKERDLAASPFVDYSRTRPVKVGEVEVDKVEVGHHGLHPDQIAALSEAINLLDELQERMISHDIPAAMPLISDTRQRIASLITGDYRQPRFHLSHPTRA